MKASPEPAGNARRDALVARSAALLVGGRVLGGVLAVGSVALLVRHLTVQEFGLYSYAVTLLSLLRVLVGFGGNDVATAEMAREPARARETLGALLTLRVVGAVLATSVYTLVVTSTESEARGALLLAGPFLLFSAGKAFDTVLQVRQHMGVVALARLLGQAGFLLAVLLLAVAGTLSLRWAVVLSAATAAFAQLAVVLRGLRHERPVLSLSPAPALRFLGRSWPQALATVFGLLTFHLDTVMLRHLEGPHETGIYGAGYRLFAFALMIPALLAAPLLPEMARGSADRSRLFFVGVRTMVVLGLSTALAAYFLAPFVIDVLYDHEQYSQSIPVLRMLFAAFVGHALATVCGTALLSAGRQRTWATIASFVLALNVVLNVALIPRYGAAGAALATVVTESAGALLALAIVLPWLRRAAGPS